MCGGLAACHSWACRLLPRHTKSLLVDSLARPRINVTAGLAASRSTFAPAAIGLLLSWSHFSSAETAQVHSSLNDRTPPRAALVVLTLSPTFHSAVGTGSTPAYRPTATSHSGPVGVAVSIVSTSRGARPHRSSSTSPQPQPAPSLGSSHSLAVLFVHSIFAGESNPGMQRTRYARR